MRLLAVPNWSFGREKALLRRFREVLGHPAVELHYCEADIDHNRTITAFSGEEDVVSDMIFRLAMFAFDTIDLNHHVGVHPRLGALDVCPLVILDQDPANRGVLMRALAVAENLAGRLAASFDLPIFLYEKSERGRHEADLPSLRKGGFGALLETPLKPDFGPSGAHPRLGATVLGVRDPLIAFNVNFDTDDIDVAETLARQVRQMRVEGDERVLGVRVMGLALPSKDQTQLHFNLTLPDVTPVDPIIEWVYQQVTKVKVKIADSELIGVIRNTDVPGASRLLIRPMQIVEG
jgi:glutamate formiminotransferase / 5-formyltetrahydrofolate cyclo-ligase